MTFEELRAFARAAELGGVSAAARALGLPKSSVSRLVASLEAGLGVRLVQRSARGLAPTEEGRLFLDHARRILREREAAEAAVAPGGAALAGTLRVTCPHTLGTALLAPILPAFLGRHPGLRMELHMTGRRVDLVEEGFDLAIRTGAPVSSSLVMRRLAPNPVRLLAAPAYLAANGAPASPAALAAHPLLLLARAPGEAHLDLQRGEGRDVDRARLTVLPRLAADDPAPLLAAAVAGLGIAVAPLVLARAHLDAGALTLVLPDWHPPAGDVCALFPSGRGLAPRVRAFLDFLTEALAPSLRAAVAEAGSDARDAAA